MAIHMREQLLRAVLAHAQGEIEKHKVNVNVYLENPVGIGEHSDITEAIQEELDGGEIIMQGEVAILPEDNIKSLTKAIQRKEYAILPLAIEHVKQQLLQQAS